MSGPGDIAGGPEDVMSGPGDIARGSEDGASAPAAAGNDVPRNPEDARSPGDGLAAPQAAPPRPGPVAWAPEEAGRAPGSPLAAGPGAAPAAAPPAAEAPRGELAGSEEMQRLVSRWKEIQAEFVDEPGSAVAKADELVAETMERVAAMFARERDALGQGRSGSGGISPDTEELRQSLRRYRALFERLLAA